MYAITLTCESCYEHCLEKCYCVYTHELIIYFATNSMTDAIQYTQNSNKEHKNKHTRITALQYT